MRRSHVYFDVNRVLPNRGYQRRSLNLIQWASVSKWWLAQFCRTDSLPMIIITFWWNEMILESTLYWCELPHIDNIKVRRYASLDCRALMGVVLLVAQCSDRISAWHRHSLNAWLTDEIFVESNRLWCNITLYCIQLHTTRQCGMWYIDNITVSSKTPRHSLLLCTSVINALGEMHCIRR